MCALECLVRRTLWHALCHWCVSTRKGWCGQGCVNGAVRSKLQFAVVQRAVERLGNGYGFRGYGQVGQLVYADDALYMAETVADLQMMFDTCWMMMTMMELQVMIKGKSKTAFMATYWE